MIITMTLNGKRGKTHTLSFERSGLPDQDVYVVLYEGGIKGKTVASTMVTQQEFRKLSGFMVIQEEIS